MCIVVDNMSVLRIWKRGKIWIKILIIIAVIELLTLGLYMVGEHIGIPKRGIINPISFYLEVVLEIIVLLIFIITFELLKRSKILNILFYKKYTILFFFTLITAILIEIFEDSGYVPGNMFPYSLINDALYVVIFASLLDFLYDAIIVAGIKERRKLLDSPLTSLSSIIALYPIVILIIGLTSTKKPIVIDTFAIGDALISIIFISVLAYYFIRIYEFKLPFGFYDYVDIINSFIILLVGFNLGDIVENFLEISLAPLILIYFVLVSSITFTMILLVFNGLYNLINIVSPYVFKKIFSNFHILINVVYDEPFLINSKIFSLIRTYISKIGGINDKVLVVIGRLNTLQKIILYATLGNIRVITVNIYEYGAFVSRTDVKDEIINVIESYDIVASPTHILGVLNDVAEKYSDKQIIVLYNTLSDLFLMMGVRRAYLAIRNILSNEFLKRRIVGSFYVILENAHRGGDIELIKTIIPRVIRL